MMNFLIDSKSNEDDVIQIQSRSMSDPLLSKIKWLGYGLPLSELGFYIFLGRVWLYIGREIKWTFKKDEDGTLRAIGDDDITSDNGENCEWEYGLISP